MKNYKLFFAIILSTVLSCKNEVKERPGKNGGEPIEEVTKVITSTFEDLDGNPVELRDFSGKRILVNFWATWCKPCIEEMPAMLRAQEALVDENYVFLLASDQSLEKILAFKEKKKFDFRFLKFNGSLADMQISALPATFIYNGSGKFVNRIDGATEWDSPRILGKLKAIQ